LGYLFGGGTWSKEKTEMFVMVTPHVINNVEEADILSSTFNDRIKVIREKILKIKEHKEITKIPVQEASDTAAQKSPENESTKSKTDTAKEPAPAEIDVPQPYVP
ncbi:hypothetical protein ACFL4R_01815, partial [Nitrospirota bacterium]